MPSHAAASRVLLSGLVLLLPLAGAAQSIDEFPLAPGSGPAGLATGLDGNVWFAEETGNRIGRLTPGGLLTEFPLSVPARRPFGVSPAADGVAFTERAGGIGRITSAGTITEEPHPGTEPKQIAPGPFAQLWYSDPSHDFIGSTPFAGSGPSGGGFPLAAGARPEGVATGAGGDLWVAENGAGSLARLYYQPRPPGIPGLGSVQIQQLPLPDRTVGPFGICYGPDGNVWFTELAAGRIGRMSPSGAVVEFPLPAGAEPRGIATGADLNLWITDAARDRILRMTPDGVVTEFPLPTAGARPDQIIAGPDGRIWFSEPGADRIGRLSIPPDCFSNERVLCLNGGRFQASVAWFFSRETPLAGIGRTLPLTSDTGAFWFFTPNNIELVVKVVDGRPLNGKFWVFVGTLTDGNWVVTIRDTQTGAVRFYQSAVDAMRSLADTDAF